jgi:Zn-dependent M28 family amino/carboxypeptidase
VELVRGEAERAGWQVTLAPPSPGSDYYPFVRRGVPAVFFVPGDGPFEGLGVPTG